MSHYRTTGGRGPDPRTEHDHKPLPANVIDRHASELGIVVQVCECGWERKHVTGTDQYGEWREP